MTLSDETLAAPESGDSFLSTLTPAPDKAPSAPLDTGELWPEPKPEDALPLHAAAPEPKHGFLDFLFGGSPGEKPPRRDRQSGIHPVAPAPLV